MSDTVTTRSIAAVLVVALLGAGIVGVVAQQATVQQQTETDAEPDQDTAYLRVVHGSPDAPAVDVFVDGERAVANLSFGSASEYHPLPGGDHALRITAAGDPDTVVLEDNITLSSRTVMTLMATGEVGENASTRFAPVVFEDDAFEPAANESAVSVVHLSPDAGAVDVTTDNGTALIADDIGFRQAGDYVNVPAGNHTLEVRNATEDDNGSIVATADVALEGGAAYSVLALGYRNPETARGNVSLELVPVEDVTFALHLPSEEVADNQTATTEAPMAGTTPTGEAPMNGPTETEAATPAEG